MSNGLVTFFKDRIKNFPSENKWDTEIKRLYLASEYDHEALTFVVNSCLDFKIDHLDDYILCMHKILTASLLLHFFKVEDRSFYSLLQTAIENAQKHSYWKDFQLGFALSSLACHLLGIKSEEIIPKLLPSGAALVEHGGHFLEAHLPNPLINAELGIVWALLGMSKNNDDLIFSALKLGYFQLNTVDYNGAPFEGLWLKEKEYARSELLAYNYVLFDICEGLSKHPKIQLARDNQLRELTRFPLEDFEKNLVYILLLAELFEENLSTYAAADPLQSKISELGINRIDKDLGFCHYCYNDFNLICSASGANTGIGSLHKDLVHITNMGPHLYPLGDSNGFGIYRSSPKNASFDDVLISSEDGALNFKGWTRLLSQDSQSSKIMPGNSWMEFHLEGFESRCKLSVRFNHTEKTPLAFTFFIKADKAVVDQKFELFPNTMDRYLDKACLMSFNRGGNTLTIYPTFEGEMEVIPLAGKNHFWGGDFLLAFPITQKQQKISWEIH